MVDYKKYENKNLRELKKSKYEFVTRAESGLDKIAEDIKKELSNEEILKMQEEVEYLTNKDYGDELWNSI